MCGREHARCELDHLRCMCGGESGHFWVMRAVPGRSGGKHEHDIMRELQCKQSWRRW